MLADDLLQLGPLVRHQLVEQPDIHVERALAVVDRVALVLLLLHVLAVLTTDVEQLLVVPRLFMEAPPGLLVLLLLELVHLDLVLVLQLTLSEPALLLEGRELLLHLLQGVLGLLVLETLLVELVLQVAVPVHDGLEGVPFAIQDERRGPAGQVT